MQPAPGTEQPPVPSATRLRLMAVVWPSFLFAAVLEMLVFAFVDPHDLQGVSRETAYTLAFFVFWACIAGACAMTAWLLPVAEPR